MTAKTAWLTLEAASPASSRRSALAAVARFWYWQVGRRTRGGALDVQLRPQRIRFRIPAWSQIGGMIVANGSHEVSETPFLARTLNPGNVFYDVGANIGLYTVLAAGAGARVVAFEPNDRAGRALRRNVALSEAEDRVEGRSVALADFDGEASFTTGLEVGNHPCEAKDTDSDVTVTVCRLDTLAAPDQLPWPVPRCLAFLKVDAEGHDLGVLRGATDLLSQHSPIVMVETWAGELRCGSSSTAWVTASTRMTNGVVDFGSTPPHWSGQANFFAIRSRQLPELECRLAGSFIPAAVAPPRIFGWIAP
ncbi:MAG: FkbM family methyltransferase [Dermatophilaceae bacterium]